DRMIGLMARRRHAAVALLVASLAGSGSALAQAAEEDSGWFDPEPAPAAPASAQSVAPAPSPQAEAAPRPAPPSDDADPRALSDFRPHLDPHGRWVED